MPGPLGFDVGGIVRDISDRVGFVLSADQTVQEIVDILRDTHRILAKLEQTVDRFEATARSYEAKTADIDLEVYSKRFDRLEEAVLNIERATLSVEGALGALPKTVRQRIAKERRTQAPRSKPTTTT